MKLAGYSYKIALLPFLLVFFISFSKNIGGVSLSNDKDMLMNIYLMLLLLLFPFSKAIKPMHPYVYIFSIGYLFISQLSYAFNIPFVVDYFEMFYKYQGDQLGYQSEFLLSGAGDLDFTKYRRYGGLFHNPNQAMKYMTLLYLGALLFWAKNSLPKFLIISLIVFTSVILSGSRTALIIYSITSVFYVFFKVKLTGNNSVFSFVAAILGVIYGALYIANKFKSERSFAVDDGLSDSIGVKFDWFFEVFRQLDIGDLLFGHFWRSSLANYNVQILDSEIGYLIYDFGIMGLFAWILAVSYLFYLCPKSYRLIFIFLLWSISSTILMSYRTSFVFFIVLSSCLLAQPSKYNRKVF